jgi:Holliday junction DNA helicase RuvB
MKDDRALRPKNISDFVGQEKIVNNLKVYIKSAKIRNAALDHILFTGPAGLGKTSISNIIANEFGTRCVIINATTVKNKGELISVISSLKKNDILFIDEIHALNSRIEEVLYTAMEDFSIDLAVDGESVRLEFEPFTLIGATTVSGLVSKPLLDRFGEVMELQPYSVSEISEIIKKSFSRLGVGILDEASDVLASRTKGIPRIANRLVKRVIDFMLCNNRTIATVDDITLTCSHLGIDHLGLEESSRNYVKAVSKHLRPVGLNTVSSLINESEETVSNTIEPYVLRLGLVEKTQKGRIITQKGVDYINSL